MQRDDDQRRGRGRYGPDGGSSAGALHDLESDNRANRATASPDPGARDSWQNDESTSGRHRRAGRPPMDDVDRGARRPGATSRAGTGSLRSARSLAPTASLDAGPDGRRQGNYAARSDVSPTAGAPAEGPAAAGLDATPRLAGLAWLAAGAGVAVDGLAVTLAWRGSPLGGPLFWLALIAPFLVFVTILTRCRPSRATRQLTVVLLGLCPAVVYRMSSPLVLQDFDEHLHQRTLSDLLHGSGLFAPNPLLIVSPRYPGLELFTGVLIRLTGLPLMAGMSLAVLIIRLVFVLAIYHGALDITRSYRRASLMVIFYAASPQFYFFDGLFAYETIALALAVGGLVVLNRALQEDFPGPRMPVVVIATLALLGSVVSHHATSWLALAFLIGWTATSKSANRRTLAYVTAIMAAAVIFWTGLSINQLMPYMGGIFSAIIDHLLSSIGKVHLFKDKAGYAEPAFQRVIIILYALLATAVAIMSGFMVLRKAHRERRYTLALIALLCIAFPTTIASHFVASTTFYGDRASDFLALPVALCCALVLRNPINALQLRRERSRIYFVSLVGAATLGFLGGVIMSSGPSWNLLPGRYLVSADGRTQDPETLAAVQWAATHLPAGSRVVADRVPANLLSSQARMWPVYHPADGLIPAAIYFSSTWKPHFDVILKRLNIEYIYVDMRLDTSLPQEGYYISAGETAKPIRLTRADLTKFNHVPGLAVVYHHGPVTIYDTAGLGVRMTTRTGFAGTRLLGFSPPLEVVAGAVVGLLLVLPRRRWARLAHALRYAGAEGYGMAIIALAILVGAVLFQTRWMPGPEFTVGALAMVVPVVIARRWADGQRIVPPLRIARAVHPLAVLGVLALIGGVLLDIHSAWAVDVTAVDHILRSVSSGRH